MKTISFINYIIAVMFFACFAYQLLYLIIPFVRRSKTYDTAKLHKYAVLIAARNEEAVISNLIESIKNQSYPSELIKVFVVADNCTDDTAARARAAGAVVFERFNRIKVGKGYAMNFLLNKIKEEYADEQFDGYFVFDADNLLDENYITEMNKCFSAGHRIITSYRNSKNYGRNWVSAGSALWFLRESQYLNRSRMLLGTSCAVSGTGFLFHHDIIEASGGWNFFLLTEDIEFSIYNIIKGEKIAYCESAMIYDEQPLEFSQSWNQRMRWMKGNLQVCQKYGWKLVKSIFHKAGFSGYDMTMTVIPVIILTGLSGTVNLLGIVYALVAKSDIMDILASIWKSVTNAYLMIYGLGLIATITEWKKIYCPAFKKILYTFTFPIFAFSSYIITFAALFSKVEWKQIEHKESLTLKDVRKMEQQI